MMRLLKTWWIEVVWVAGCILLRLNYVWDQRSIKCEACMDFRWCPPCETPFMADFWEYLAVFNAIVVVSMIIRRVLATRSA